MLSLPGLVQFEQQRDFLQGIRVVKENVLILFSTAQQFFEAVLLSKHCKTEEYGEPQQFITLHGSDPTSCLFSISH